MMYRMQHQRGSVLIVSLIMLIAMTLLAITSINMSTINLRIVGNMQTQMEAETAVQNAIEATISSLANFESPASTSTVVTGYTVQVDAPQCALSSPATGYEATYSIIAIAGSRYDNDWMVTARNTAGATGGEYAELTQGVRVLEVVTECP